MTGIFPKLTAVIVTALLACVVAFSIKRFVTGAPGQTAATSSTVDPVKEIAGYRNWTKVNAVPQLMPERVSQLCGLWLAPSGVVVDGTKNPHRHKFFTVYVNGIGREAMLSAKPQTFPEGSVIIKEKLAAKDSQAPELLTVMIKQKRGFNPGAGDWEYMVVDGTGTKVAGRGILADCQSCHVARQKTDYVFRTYRPAETAER